MTKFEIALNLMESTAGTLQNEENHPEKDVFIHSLQVMRLAFKESNDIDLILAAMLHDVGKPFDTLGHDNIAADNLEGFMCFSDKTIWLVRHHLRIIWMLNGRMKKQKKVQYLINHPWFTDLCMLSRWDRMGRKPNYTVKYVREKVLERLSKFEG